MICPTRWENLCTNVNSSLVEDIGYERVSSIYISSSVPTKQHIKQLQLVHYSSETCSRNLTPEPLPFPSCVFVCSSRPPVPVPLSTNRWLVSEWMRVGPCSCSSWSMPMARVGPGLSPFLWLLSTSLNFQNVWWKSSWVSSFPPSAFSSHIMALGSEEPFSFCWFVSVGCKKERDRIGINVSWTSLKMYHNWRVVVIVWWLC